jgi:hypothetical protein
MPNDLHFHVHGETFADILEAARGVADRYFGYTAEVDNADYTAWKDKLAEWENNNEEPELRVDWDAENPEPDRTVANTEERPYRLEIQANLAVGEIDKNNARYSWSRDTTFRASVRAYLPWDREVD